MPIPAKAQFALRYRHLPSWVLLAQLFLASGWLRAATAHGFDNKWWDGTAVATFRAGHLGSSIEWYRTIMLDGPVAAWPIVFAVVVFAGQVLVGFMLVLNARPLLALAVGAWMNIHFVLAGAVNPSVFYLIIGAVVALWHVESSLRSASVQRLTLISTLVVAVLLGALTPEIATMDPASMIDDPALVLSFVSMLWVLALWVSLRGPSTGVVPIPATRRDSTVATTRSTHDEYRHPLNGGRTLPRATRDPSDWTAQPPSEPGRFVDLVVQGLTRREPAGIVEQDLRPSFVPAGSAGDRHVRGEQNARNIP